MATTSPHPAHETRVTTADRKAPRPPQETLEAWARATRDPSELVLRDPMGDMGGSVEYGDLFDGEGLARLTESFDRYFAREDPESFARMEAYRAAGDAAGPELVSEALLGAAPVVSRFVATLFGVEAEHAALAGATQARSPLWSFKKELAKKRLFKPSAGSSWKQGDALAERVARAALVAAGMPEALLGRGDDDEELALATAALAIHTVDDVARRAAKAGGAKLEPGHLALVGELRRAARATAAELPSLEPSADPEPEASITALTGALLDALERWLTTRRADHHDGASRWASLHAPKNLDYEALVQIRRPDPKLPEAFVGPEEHRRERDGFQLTDRRAERRGVEAEVDYCLLCHDRDKDSCSKGLRENKPQADGRRALKKNPLGVELAGCPLEEKISEMHAMRGAGDSLAALALITVDNPMLPGTGHRICNDCMKACVFQKQEPVNIPQVETGVLTDVLGLPWGLEIYGFLTRWNPLSIARRHARPYNGKNVLVVGLGPAGYTLAHHLACEGFGVVAVDGLKLEPLPVELTGDFHGDVRKLPRPVRDFSELYVELDERILLGFGGVSEYGITVRWDKNFLTVAYVTLARHQNLRMYGGVRFGGTLTLDDAFAAGFDHVALAAGAGKPTLVSMKNNLARGIRKASDFLMALQLTGAYKASALANLQVRLPALVIGGGLTAIDTATELIAYYVKQVEKTARRYDTLAREGAAALASLDAEEREVVDEQLAHARELAEERELARREGREPRLQALIERWGGVRLVYRKRLLDSPAYRLNHEEVEKSLEEGVIYVENLAPTEAVLDERGHVRSMRFERQLPPSAESPSWRATGELVELAARTVCVAAGTSPNVTYEKEYPGTFAFDDRKQYFRTHKATLDAEGRVSLEPCKPHEGFFTSYLRDGRAVSFYGDNHPHYAGSVVKAMASAKDGYSKVTALFAPALARLGDEPQAARDARRRALFTKLDDELVPVVHSVTRLTPTIVEVVVRAPAAARKFEPGQFYRLQNFETKSRMAEGTRLSMEGLALTGAWVDKEQGLLSMIALEMGASSRLLAELTVGEEVVVMGPTGAPTEIPEGETVLLAGGGLGNAVLFSISKALRDNGDRVVYFAGYKRGEDLFKQDDIEAATDQVIWCTDAGVEIAPRRPQDRHFRGNIVEAMVAYARRELGGELFALRDVRRIIAIGSDRMMNAVRDARHGVLAPHLDPKHVGIGSINSPMQCMMKEVCAQCLQKHRDPETGKETVVFTCFNQDQPLDHVDFDHLRERLRLNSAQEKLSAGWLEHLVARAPAPRV